MITRTIVKETVIEYYFIKDDSRSENKTITIGGLVNNPVALIKKSEKLSKFDSVVLVNVHEEKVKYGMDVAKFIDNAEVIE